MNPTRRVVLIVSLLSSFVGPRRAEASMQFEARYCENVVTDPSVNNTVREIFQNKVERLAKLNLLPGEFWAKNKSLVFAVCNNRSYDTFVVYGKGVVFDQQMIGFLLAQSRALMVGRYISQATQFDVHDELVRQFVSQGPEINAGPFPIIEKKALALGMAKRAFDITLAEPEFAKREQTLFLQAMYFLVMHERCHVALDHETRLKEMQGLPDIDKISRKQNLELAADRCAIDIINADEAQFSSSPISFFGVLMTVATQSIITNHPQLGTDRSHPSTEKRMDAALDQVLGFLSKTDSKTREEYVATIKGTAAYFRALLKRLASRR